jgi:hypothetical protein
MLRTASTRAIVFRSTRVELAEDGGVALDGELEIKTTCPGSPRAS